MAFLMLPHTFSLPGLKHLESELSNEKFHDIVSLKFVLLDFTNFMTNNSTVVHTCNTLLESSIFEWVLPGGQDWPNI